MLTHKKCYVIIYKLSGETATKKVKHKINFKKIKKKWLTKKNVYDNINKLLQKSTEKFLKVQKSIKKINKKIEKKYLTN